MSVIKVKMRGEQKAQLLTPTGGLTRLRIHALTGSWDHLSKIAADVQADNPEKVEWAKVAS